MSASDESDHEEAQPIQQEEGKLESSNKPVDIVKRVDDDPLKSDRLKVLGFVRGVKSNTKQFLADAKDTMQSCLKFAEDVSTKFSSLYYVVNRTNDNLDKLSGLDCIPEDHIAAF